MLVVDKLKSYDRLLTSVEVSKLFGIHPTTIVWYSHQGLLPHLKIGARSYRYDPHELIAYLVVQSQHMNRDAVEQYLSERGVALLPEQVDRVWRCLAEVMTTPVEPNQL
jgi:DNA-binding transcriptional MerR regulator